jgi:hypothetical protein
MVRSLFFDIFISRGFRLIGSKEHVPAAVMPPLKLFEGGGFAHLKGDRVREDLPSVSLEFCFSYAYNHCFPHVVLIYLESGIRALPKLSQFYLDFFRLFKNPDS